MGHCRYEYNPSELYQRTKPGTSPETICGARTFPAMDEPEVACVKTGMGPDGAVYEYRPTGQMVQRAQDDPFCPGHGGSQPPPPPPVHLAELEWAYQAYQELAARYAAQAGGALPSAAAQELPAPEARAAGSQLLAPALSLAPASADAHAGGAVTAQDLADAAAHLQGLATAAGEAARA